MTKQSGYATKQTGYFWTKQLGLNNYTAQTLEVDAGTEVLCRCSGRRGGEIYLNGDMLSAGTDATYTANKNATIEFDTSGASYYLRITEI